MRFSIEDYAKTFKMSKEMIHNKIRTKKLNYIVEGGIPYIIVHSNSIDGNPQPASLDKSTSPTTSPVPTKTSIGMVISLYQKENHHLKLKIKELEAKVDSLIHDKEQMLIADRNRIEEIYTAKDEQLKSILEVLSTKLMLSHNDNTVHDVIATQPQNLTPLSSTGIIELKRYLKFIGIGSEDRKIIRNRFSQGYGSDIRIIQKEGEFYVDLSKYDYTDLL